jgi:aminopeptidase-like protein
MYGEFPEYHTSADNLDFVSEASLRESLNMYTQVLMSYEANCRYKRIQPYCEPQLGKYNLYRTTGGAGEDNLDTIVQQRMWVLNYSDGETDLLKIATLSGFDILDLKLVADELSKKNLIEEIKYD